MADKIYFETLACAVNDAVIRAVNRGAAFLAADLERFCDQWNGGVRYGETVTHTCALSSLKGRGTRKAMTVVIYRMESGRYELTTYVN